MTVLVDMTNTADLPYPYLTGIQRVVIHVLSELITARSDVRLVRFDVQSSELVFMEISELPEPFRRYGNLNLAPAVDRPAAVNGLAWPFQHLRRIKNKITSRSTAARAAYGYVVSVLRSFTGPSADHPPPTSPVVMSGVGQDDIILCLGLTWFVPGYWDALRRVKRDGAKVIQLIHDINFVTHTQWVPTECINEGRAWFDTAIESADILVVTSQFLQNEVERYMRNGRAMSRPLARIRLGDDPPWLIVPQRAPSNGGYTPFVMYVSGFYPRKNHVALYHVWSRLIRERGTDCPDLMLLGWPGAPRLELIDHIAADPATRDKIHIRFDVGDEELSRLYRSCLFTVYPSHYEGSGLPLAESLRLGRFCIASAAEALREVGGNLVDHFDSTDEEEFYQRIIHALDTPGYVAMREDAIRKQYKPWSWKQTAAQVADVIDRLDAITKPRMAS
jgi:glycosyltransferase involved in cell wall biosynthesis